VDLGKLDIHYPEPGDIVTVLTPGGGGHGDPLDRSLDAVADDVRLGYVSAAAARADYGAVFNDGQLDGPATEALRTKLRTERGPAAPFDFGPERRAWEQVFDDSAMTELNALLMPMGATIRSQRRERIFHAVIPGLAAGKGQPLADLVGDPIAARVRLAEQIARLRTHLNPQEG